MANKTDDLLIKHITDPKAKEEAHQFIAELSRLDQFPTCLGRAIDAYDAARMLPIADRALLATLFENLSKSLNDDLTVDVEDYHTAVTASLDALRKSKHNVENQKVVNNLKGVFPSPLDFIIKIHH